MLWYRDLQLGCLCAGACVSCFCPCVYIFVQSLDLSKANWTLRVVSDTGQSESIKVTKDTERRDWIKATKTAWEMAEAGRCARVTSSCDSM